MGTPPVCRARRLLATPAGEGHIQGRRRAAPCHWIRTELYPDGTPRTPHNGRVLNRLAPCPSVLSEGRDRIHAGGSQGGDRHGQHARCDDDQQARGVRRGIVHRTYVRSLLSAIEALGDTAKIGEPSCRDRVIELWTDHDMSRSGFQPGAADGEPDRRNAEPIEAPRVGRDLTTCAGHGYAVKSASVPCLTESTRTGQEENGPWYRVAVQRHRHRAKERAVWQLLSTRSGPFCVSVTLAHS